MKADRGLNVQDYFASHDVTVAIPHFTKDQGYLPFKDLQKDRKFAKFRVHVKRMVAFSKTHKILLSKIKHTLIPMTSEF